MSKHFPELTDKMEYLFTDIVASLGSFPLEQIGCLFGYEKEDMQVEIGMAGYITMEYIKYAFDYDDPVYPLRYFLKEGNGSDDERMLQQRILEYALKYKKREIESLGLSLPQDHKFADLSMDNIGKKLQGYKLTEMNYFELQNIHDLELVKAIVQNRIGSSKKISNKRFQDIFAQYDSFVEGLREKTKKSDKDMVFYSIALFTLEWHYPIETFYYIAQIMEKNGIDEVSQSDLILLCGNIGVESRFGGWYQTQSRMVKERFCFLDALFSNNVNPVRKEAARGVLKELLVLGVQYKEELYCMDGRKYREWFRSESNLADWASFFRFYDIFSIWQKKEWTPKRIQNMRKLLDVATTDKI